MCTRVFNNSSAIKVVGRSMDWPESTRPRIVVNPRGLQRNGGMLGPIQVEKENPLQWTSLYGNVATSIYDLGSVDGINEKGLGVHGLFLTATKLPERIDDLPVLHMGLWAQYLLDCAATVTEALALMDGVQLMMVTAEGRDSSIHMAIEDASGDSAVIEFVDGERRIYHGSEYQLMTNDPAYSEQLALLAQQDFSHPSSDMPLPGNVNPRDRFQRASYYLNLLPAAESVQEAVAGVMAIVRNCSVPFGAPYKGFGIYNTEYRTVCDLTDRLYFFELSTSPSVIWVDLKKLDFSEGLPMTAIDPNSGFYNGDISADITEAAAVMY
ncbi:MAG: linear amide C-N hydrolase [Thermomicrobiales bacterium]|nr:linear amide C-N hydrolase [Thermomicrobiales bacterium]